MKQSLIILFLLMSGKLFSQNLQVVTFAELQPILNNNNDSLKVVNLWATWCKPCVEELPLFVQAQKEFTNQKVEFIFVSLDFMSQTDGVKKKIAELQLPGTCLQLNEKGIEWIDQLDKEWPGAIPYTILILPDGKRREHYDAFDSFDQLQSFIQEGVNKEMRE